MRRIKASSILNQDKILSFRPRVEPKEQLTYKMFVRNKAQYKGHAFDDKSLFVLQHAISLLIDSYLTSSEQYVSFT